MPCLPRARVRVETLKSVRILENDEATKKLQCCGVDIYAPLGRDE